MEDCGTPRLMDSSSEEKKDMSIEEQIELCWNEHDKAAAAGDGQENILRMVAGDVTIKPEGKRPRIKRSYMKGQRRRSLNAHSPQPAA